jgi:hypothetical protein
MKLKKEYFILAAILVALILYLALHRSNRTQYQLPELSEVSGKHISKLEITTAGNSITFNKKDNTWHIEPKGYRADSTKVKNILNVIEKLKLTALVSESKNYVRYDLINDKNIHVKAWQGKTLVREIDIGKAAPTFKHTFVKLPDDPNVYYASGNFRSDFDQSMENLRDKVVLSFDKEEIHKIRIIKGRQLMVINRRQIPVDVTVGQKEQAKEAAVSETEAVWQTDNGKNVDEAKLNRLLSTLSKLSCDKYINGREKGEFNNPIYTLMLKGSQDYSLSVYAKIDEDSENYSAISSENDDPFELSKWKIDDIMKNPDEMLEKDEPKKTSK